MPKVTMISPATKQTVDKKRVAAYCRVSSSSADQLNSYANQIRVYTAMINARKDWQLVEIFADEGITGTSAEKRSEFQRMITMCERHEIDLIITKSVSRFARNVKDALEYVRKLKLLGVEVKFEKEGISTLSLGDEMLLNTFAAIAQEESVAISQNLRMSIKKRMENGTYIGPHTSYGYTGSSKKNTTVSKEEANIVKRIFSEYLDGKSTVEIANGLNCDNITAPKSKKKWWPSAVTYILTNESCIGDTLLQKTCSTETFPFKKMRNNGVEDKFYVAGTHAPLIDKEQFRTAEKLVEIQRDRFARNKVRTRYAFTSMITCSLCNSKFKRRIKNGEICWACSKKVDNAESCKSHYYKEEEINAAIVLLFNNLRFDDKILLRTEQLLTEAVNLSRRGSADISYANTSIAELNAKLLSIEQLKSKGYLSPEVCQAQTKSIERELARLKEKRQKLYDSKVSTTLDEVQKLRATLNQINEPLDEIDEQLFKDVVEGLSIDTDSNLTVRFKCGLRFRERLEG